MMELESGIVPIFIQYGYRATVTYNPETGLTEVTLLLQDNLRFTHRLIAKIYPGNPCQKCLGSAFNLSFKDVQKEEQRAKNVLRYAIQETIKIYESYKKMEKAE